MAAVLVALILRLWHIRHGLPEFTEEAIPFRKALEMWRPDGGVDWNPHLFHYPSLTIYLQLLVQKLHYLFGHLAGVYRVPADYPLGVQVDPTAMVVCGRLVGVLADLATVVCAARIAERLWPRAGIVAAFLVACAPTLILASRSIFTDTVMTALAVAALERMLAWRERGGRGRLAAAVILIGLASGAKYPAVVLLIPLGVVMLERLRLRVLLPWIACAAAVAVILLLTTPYAVLDFATFSRDFSFVSRLGAEGHLGNIDRPGFGFHLSRLLVDVGVLGLALLVASFALTIARPLRRVDALAVWVTLLAFGVPIALAHVLAERYLVPVLPLAAVLIAAAALEAAAWLGSAPRITPGARRAILVVAAAALALPVLTAGVRAAATGAGSTQARARRWCEQNLGPNDVVVQEHYGAALLGRLESFEVQTRPMFQAASPAMQERFHARRWFSTVTLPLGVVGSPNVRLRTRAGEVEVPVYPHAADFNQACYDPRLLDGVDYFVTSSLVRGRFEDDTVRYAQQHRFYMLLDSTAAVAARFRPGPADLGPEIVIHRLGPPARAAIAARGPVDPLWWATYVPREFRRRADSLQTGRVASLEVRDSTGAPTAWVSSLAPIFAARYAPFTGSLAMELMEQRRFEPARRLARTLFAIDPGDVQACLMLVNADVELGDWSEARRVVETTLAASRRKGREPSPYLRLTYGDVLAHDGERERARRELEAALATGDDYVRGEARRRLADPSGSLRAPR